MPGVRSMTVFTLPGIPEVQAGDDLAALIADALEAAGETLELGDIIVTAQKIVSKAEGRYIELADMTPGDEALEWAAKAEKDPRLVQAILDETEKVLRWRPNLLVVEHKRGWVMANAGADQSNIEGAEGERVLMLPLDPDASAASIRSGLEARYGGPVGVIIADSVGRAWRVGTVGLALGASGVRVMADIRGELDRQGRELKVSIVGAGDEIAAAANLLIGEAAEGTPVAVVRGLDMLDGSQTGANLVRASSEDLFR
jgi:coenzyme F420-0:L-glutamate ligase / coenzyme F420-1:gamma-L-glutamate ligase